MDAMPILSREEKEKTVLANAVVALNSARNRHPRFCRNHEEALSILTEEVGEVAKALNDRDEIPQELRGEALDSELYDVIVVCLRMLLREYTYDCPTRRFRGDMAWAWKAMCREEDEE